jgi:CDP-glucose 4,6-dehydratase
MESLQIHGEAFNFSNERFFTVLELVDIILESAGRPDLEPIILNEANNEIPKQYLSSEKARKTLGWAPRYSLVDAMKETVEWYRGYLLFCAKNETAGGQPTPRSHE